MAQGVDLSSNTFGVQVVLNINNNYTLCDNTQYNTHMRHSRYNELYTFRLTSTLRSFD